MTLPEMKRIIESNDAVWQGWWPSLLRLTPSQLQQPIVGSYPNILSTVEHAVGAELYWQGRLENEPDSVDPGPLTLWGDIKDRWGALQTRRLGWLSNADPDAEVRFKGDDGRAKSIRAWECIVHMTSHSHFHRGQLALQFRQIDLVPPSHHLIGRFMSR
jgi:uncharacterized damage-inducible protein DinB